MVGDIDLKEKTIEKTMEVARTASGNLKIAKDKLMTAIDQHIANPAKEAAKNMAEKKEDQKKNDDTAPLPQSSDSQMEISIKGAEAAIKDETKKEVKSKAESVIEFKNVSKIYPGKIVAVDKVSLSIKRGNLFLWLVLLVPENRL